VTVEFAFAWALNTLIGVAGGFILGAMMASRSRGCYSPTRMPSIGTEGHPKKGGQNADFAFSERPGSPAPMRAPQGYSSALPPRGKDNP
jgi:hypothetical protein